MFENRERYGGIYIKLNTDSFREASLEVGLN